MILGGTSAHMFDVCKGHGILGLLRLIRELYEKYNLFGSSNFYVT